MLRARVKGRKGGMACVRAVLAMAVLAASAADAIAADLVDGSNGSLHLSTYEKDDQVSWTWPTVSWNNFDMAFYNGNVYKAYSHSKSIYYYTHGADDPPQESPDLVRIECGSRDLVAQRLCVFNGRLYLFYVNAIFYSTFSGDRGYEYTLTYRSWDDALAQWSDPIALKTWLLEYQAQICERAGMVVRVMNGSAYILFQVVNGYPSLAALRFDGAKLTGETWYDMPVGELLLNGDVIPKITEDPQDHRACIAFVTKNDGSGGSAGECTLRVYDPSAGTVAKVCKIPNGPNGKGWKDMALVQGNVDLCTAYKVSAIQLWGLPWDGKQLHHTQFVFNDAGTSGSFNPSGWVDVTGAWPDAENSEYFDNDMSGLLAVFSAPSDVVEQGTGTEALQMHTWVWWFASTTSAHCKGRSMKYLADYLRLENPNQTDTSLDKEPNDAWILLGIITALPPYYPNGADPTELDLLIDVQYGLSSTQEIKSTVTTDASFSFGYSQGGILKSAGVDGEFGITYSHAVQHTKAQSTKVTSYTHQKFSPLFSDQANYPEGQEAWALFLAPNVCNDPYQVYSPPESYAAVHPNAANDLGFTAYYMYTSSTSVKAYSFDITKPDATDFFAGFPPMPSAYDYQGWSDPAFQRQKTVDYEVLYSTGISGPGNQTTWGLDLEDGISNKNASKNTIKVSAGAFGFKTVMKGSIENTSTVSTAVTNSFEVSYGVYTHYDNDPDKYDDWDLFLTSVSFEAYLLNALTDKAFFIPDSCRSAEREQYPWCLTWYVGSWANHGGPSQYTVGEGGAYGSVGAALAAEPGKPSAAIMVTDPVTESGPIAISNRKVEIQGHPDTLDESGRPTAVIHVSGITIAPDASLRLENLILDGAVQQSSGRGNGAALLFNEGRLSMENCVVQGGGQGIRQAGGSLRMTQVYVRENSGDGIRMEAGYAELINCEFVANGDRGIAVHGGETRLKHCGALGNGESDVLCSSSGSLWADNCLFGRVAPLSQAALLRHCLVEALPDSVVLNEMEGCLLNMASGYGVAAGEIHGPTGKSPCVDAGLEAGVPTDILGRQRIGKPDMGPLEYMGSPIPAVSGPGGVIVFSLLLACLGLLIIHRRKQPSVFQ